MKFEMFDKAVSAMKDYHVPSLLGMFAVGAFLAWFHRLDMAFVAYAGVIVGGITGHAFSPAQKDHEDHDVALIDVTNPPNQPK